MIKTDVDKNLMLSHTSKGGPFAGVFMFRMKEGMLLSDFFAELATFSMDVVEEIQGEPIYSGSVDAEFTTGEKYWDHIMVIRFKNWEAVRKSITESEIIPKQNIVRRKYLEDFNWVFTTPSGN